MKTKILLFLSLVLPTAAHPIEGFFVGGQIGHVALTGGAASTFSNAIGFGIDLGFRTNPILDVVLRSGLSTHGGGTGMTLWGTTLSADFLVGHFNDIEFFLGGGPGFYQFNSGTAVGKFGLHAEAYGDLNVGDNIRIGLGLHYHGIFDPAAGQGSFWTVMMRVGLFLPAGR